MSILLERQLLGVNLKGSFKLVFLILAHRCMGETRNCCDNETPCLLGDGDCNHPGDCMSGVCGTRNCQFPGNNNDCCIENADAEALQLTSKFPNYQYLIIILFENT